MSVLSGDFLTADNLLNIGVQAAVTAILALGATNLEFATGQDSYLDDDDPLTWQADAVHASPLDLLAAWQP